MRIFYWLLIWVEPISECVVAGSIRRWYEDYMEQESLSGVSGDDSVGDCGSLRASSVIWAIAAQSYDRMLGFLLFDYENNWVFTEGAD